MGAGKNPPERNSAVATMIEEQIRRRGIHDPALEEAFYRFPRDWFVPASLRRRAFEDAPLPIGEGQTISQPYIVALMTHLLRLKGTERVLEIGTGCGYQTAILAALCSEVHSIEIVPSLHRQTLRRLEEIRAVEPVAISRIKLYLGNGRSGLPEAAPFDGILCAAATPEIPAAWVAQLKRGGQMVLPVGREGQDLTEIFKETDDLIRKTSVIPVRFVPLV